MKNFNNLNSTSQSAEDNPKNNSQENDKSIEVSNFGSKPSLELFHNGARYGFFNRSNFDPQVTPGERSDTAIIEAHKEAYKNSPANTILSGRIKDYSEDRIEKFNNRSSETYQNSISRDSVLAVANFPAKLCASDKNLMNLSEIKDINDLKELSPRQAMLLSTNIVIKLKNYDGSEVSDRHRKADRMSTLEIMKHLSKEGDSPLGVCRNYADMTKIIFMALKKVQDPKTTRLANTYCREIVGEHPWDAVNPFKSKSTENHKYNQFITFTHNGTAITNVDPTWGQLDGNLSQYASLSMNIIEREPLVSDFIKDIRDKGYFKSPEDRKNTENLREYYMTIAKKIDKVISRLSQKGHNRENNTCFEKIQNMQYYSLLKSAELSSFLHAHGLISDQEMDKYQKVKSDIENEINNTQ